MHLSKNRQINSVFRSSYRLFCRSSVAEIELTNWSDTGRARGSQSIIHSRFASKQTRRVSCTSWATDESWQFVLIRQPFEYVDSNRNKKPGSPLYVSWLIVSRLSAANSRLSGWSNLFPTFFKTRNSRIQSTKQWIVWSIGGGDWINAEAHWLRCV